ncbi:MAG: hypothetical protein EOP04_13715 [Proteobacteria bacterium]|nr:MAG: hypothetical protein EOP04_13715 [Pseudomonadota bacterium]
MANTEWCVNNKEQSFYKSDTIKLYRIIDSLSEFQSLNRVYRLIEYNKGNNYTSIILKSNGKVEVSDHDVDSWTYKVRRGSCTWQYDMCNGKLTFFFNRKPELSFLFVESSSDSLRWEYNDFFTKKDVTDIYHLEVLKFFRLR